MRERGDARRGLRGADGGGLTVGGAVAGWQLGLALSGRGVLGLGMAALPLAARLLLRTRSV